MQSKKRLWLWLLLPPIVLFSACSVLRGSDRSASEQADVETETEETAEQSALQETPETGSKDRTDPALSTTEKQIVRIFLPDRDHKRFQMDGEYLEDQFENAGFDAIVYDAGGDPVKQAAALKQAIELQTDLCVLVPIDAREVRDAAWEIGSRGISLVIYDEPLPNMGSAAFFVGFRESDVAAMLLEAEQLEEAHREELARIAEEEAALQDAETQDSDAAGSEKGSEPEETAETETAEETEDPVIPLLGGDDEEEILRAISDGDRQAAVYCDTAGEAVVVLDIGINLLHEKMPDGGLIAASGWGFPCSYQEGEPGKRPAAFYLEPVLITKSDMEEKLVVPGYYVKDADGYLHPAPVEND